MTKNIINLILILILTYYNIFSQSTETTKNGIITGTVVSSMTQSPVPGITVKILNTKLGSYTDKQGKFKISNIPVGIYSVQFAGIGYQTYVQSDVSVTTTKPIMLEINLVEKIIELNGVEVKSSYFIKEIETVNSTQVLNAEDIRRAPGVQEDVIRATSLLPGVGVTSNSRNDLVVRGGAPFENLFIVDNLEVPNINHFGSQGSSGGPLSIINIDFVKSVSFSAGAFGARYGDKTSSITNITLRNGNETKFTTSATISASQFGINMEGPVTNKASFLFSARRSYLDFIFKAAGLGFIPEYWDFQGKFNYKLDEKNNLSFLAISAINSVSLNNSTEENKYKNSQVAIPNQIQYFSGITWKHLFGDGFLTVTLGETNTKFTTTQNDSNLIEIFKNKSQEAESILRTDFDYQITPTMELTIGNQVKWATRLQYNILIPTYLRLDSSGIGHEYKIDTNFRAYRNSTYASLTTAMGNLKFTVGGRIDYNNFLSDKITFSPRASLIYSINEVSAISLSTGRYYQTPSFIWLIGDPNQNLKPIRADQLVLGYDHTPLEDVKVQLEVYYKIYNDYPARIYRPQAVLSPTGFDDVTSDIPYGLEPLTSIGTGYARGVELFIQKKLSNIPIYGLLSISLGQSRFTAISGIEHDGKFDARLITNFALGYRLNEEWEFSGKFRLATGLPTTPFLSNGQLDYSRYNEGPRLPTFHAVDIRIDKRWNFDSFSMITYIDIQDIYNRKNKSYYRWDFRTQKVVTDNSLGILPSIGVTFQI